MRWRTRRNHISFFRRNGRVHLNRQGASVQSTTGSRVVRVSGSNAGWIHHVPRQCEEYWLPTPFACFHFTSPPVRHRVPSHFKWILPSRRLGGKPVQITGARRSGRRPGARLCCIRFCIYRWSRYLPTVHNSPFRPHAQASMQITVFTFYSKDFQTVHPCCWVGPKFYFFFPPHWGPNPLTAAVITLI